MRAVVFWFFTFIHFTLSAQNTQSHTTELFNIERIKFEGLQKNKESFLKNKISSSAFSSVSLSDIQKDVQRLKNIPGVGDANFEIIKENGSETLVFKIEEVRTLLPILNFGGIRNNVWFQLGFSDTNWQGKGNVLSAYYQNNDQRHSGNLFYKVPYIRNSKWGYSLSLNKWSSREPLFFDNQTVLYDYDNNGLGVTGIRHIDRYRNIEFGATYFVEHYAQSANQQINSEINAPTSLTQPKWLAKLSYNTQKINFHKFYLDGVAWHSIYQSVYNTLDQDWFHSIQLQARYFKRIGSKSNLATRVRLGLATNRNSPFAPFVVDSHINIRGVGNRIDRGTAQIILNTEYRFTVREKKKFGVQIVAFADAGTWRNPGGSLDQLIDPDQFRVFIGGGFRVIYQKLHNAVLRVDYGIDVFNKKQRGLVLGLGQYF